MIDFIIMERNTGNENLNYNIRFNNSLVNLVGNSMIVYKQTKQGHFPYDIKEKKDYSFYFIFIWALGLFLAFLNSWDGDPTIYFVYAKNLLNGNGLVFNLGYPSASFSSPLWLIIVTSCFVNPLFVKIGSFLILTISLYLIYKYKGIVHSGLALYLSCVPVFHGYETVLIVLATGLLFADYKQTAFIILTFTRPEAILLFPLFYFIFQIKWTSAIPVLIYYFLIFLYSGVPDSFISRTQDGLHWFGIRYALIFLPFILLYLNNFIQNHGWARYGFVAILLIGSLLKIPKEPMDFEFVTYKEVAEMLPKNSILYTTEIQTRFWNDSLFVVSKDGLLKDYKKPTHYLRMINDTLDAGILIKKYKHSTINGLYKL